MKTGKKIEARTLRGFHDKLPSEALIKAKMLATLRRVFDSFGFVPIETPHVEYLEIMGQEQTGEEIQKQLFRWLDQGERQVALRFDLTVPFARFIVQHRGEVGIPFKRYAIGEVFRGERPQAGRYREFTQCDFDFVGTDSTAADAEIVQVIATALKALGIGEFLIRVNNRRVLNGAMEILGIGDKTVDVLRTIDKKDKIGIDAVKEELRDGVGLSNDQIEGFLNFISLSAGASPSEVLEKVRSYEGKSAVFDQGVSELRTMETILAPLDSVKDCYSIDFSIARGLGYYTGIVYETVLKASPGMGSICGGGRYDNLTKSFSDEDLPGVGASFGLDRIVAALKELGLTEDTGTPAEVLIVCERADSAPVLYRTAETMRQSGINVEVFPEAVKLKNQFVYSERHGHPFIMFVESTPEGAFSCKLRNARTREQNIFNSVEEVSDYMLRERK